jgi:hypothetical protein
MLHSPHVNLERGVLWNVEVKLLGSSRLTNIYKSFHLLLNLESLFKQ